MNRSVNWAARRLGKSFLNYAVDPFLSGVYAGDPLKLITRYALPKLYNLEQQYGGFIKMARLPKPGCLKQTVTDWQPKRFSPLPVVWRIGESDGRGYRFPEYHLVGFRA